MTSHQYLLVILFLVYNPHLTITHPLFSLTF
ncbi:putative membrane protein, partial [Acinetobacter baumannii 1462234]